MKIDPGLFREGHGSNCIYQEPLKSPDTDGFSTKQEDTDSSKIGTVVTTTDKDDCQPISNCSEHTDH